MSECNKINITCIEIPCGPAIGSLQLIYITGFSNVNKWIVSDITRGLATGLASECNEINITCIEIPCGLAGGSLQYL